ncbi:hypothetical protein HK096_006509, partial [Nowakowskiella sp. JEL0078]
MASLAMRAFSSLGRPRTLFRVGAASPLQSSVCRASLSSLPLSRSAFPVRLSIPFPVMLSSTVRLASLTFILARSLFIQTENTPNLDSLKFKPGVPVLTSATTHEFLTAHSSLASPLAVSLFRIEGVRNLLFGSDFITINKHEDANWATIKPFVYEAIMEFFASNQPLFTDPAEKQSGSTEILDSDSETVVLIKELLDTKIRPTIQEDGGDVEYCGFENGLVKLKLKGSCRTCDSSVVTLKNGIENMLMHYIPEVEGVEQVLDEQDKLSQEEFDKLEN